MRIVFMGTPDFAVPALQALYDKGYELAAVYTQPDRPAGRGKKMKASPVKVLAESLNIPVYQPPKIKAPEVVKELEQLKPDCIVVVAYGQILPSEVLGIPAYGCVNVHASLLPFYRGAAPIHWAILNGEQKTGVTTMQMDQGLDTGDILLQKELALEDEITTGEVHDELAKLGAQTLTATLNKMGEGSLKPVPQLGKASYAPLLKREHESLDWNKSNEELHNKIRGLNPWPGAFTHFRGEQIKIWKSRVLRQEESRKYRLKADEDNTPGLIVDISESGIICCTGKGFIELKEVQPSGKKRMNAFAFFNGRHCQIGEQFGR